MSVGLKPIALVFIGGGIGSEMTPRHSVLLSTTAVVAGFAIVRALS
jgi:hypothetical protein